jgi:hypothetical protein
MKRTSLLTGALLFVLSLPLHAQDLESIAGLRLRLETAGSRGAAMGGTSEAADDPLAVIHNPAILARMRERTIAVDARQSDASSDVITSGTLGSFTTARQEAKTSRSRSAIAILPTRAGTWAIFVDEPLRTAIAVPATPPNYDAIRVGLYEGRLISDEQCTAIRSGADPYQHPCFLLLVNSPATNNVDARVNLRRAGTALAIRRGALSLGASGQYAQLDRASRQPFSTITTERDGQFTWNAGIQWQANSRIRAGASYQSGAEFAGTRVDYYNDGPVARTSRFRTPTSYGAGLTAELTPHLTVAADAVRVLYSDTLSGPTSNGPILLVMPDVIEFHGGAEYRLSTRIPVALRAGWWRDPSHRARFIEVDSEFTPFYPAAAYNLALLDEDEDHLTAGIGFGRTIRVDAAVDRSKHTTRGSLTVATKF